MERLVLRKPLLNALALFSAFTLVLSSQIQAAEDRKVYPAAMCEGAQVGNPPIVSYQSNKLVNNSTTNSAVVICPILRDNIYTTSGANEAYVRYFKGTNTGFIANLYSYSSYGTSSYTQFKSDYGTTGYKLFSYTPISAYSQGFYNFVVVIPPGPTGAKSSIISYRLDEN
ncbi:MAG: hypothetical protein V4629_08415 [Pseudomonadota bacterium]